MASSSPRPPRRTAKTRAAKQAASGAPGHQTSARVAASHLAVKSRIALVVDASKGQELLAKDTGRVVPIPFHKGSDVSVGLICEIISELGITRDDWLNL